MLRRLRIRLRRSFGWFRPGTRSLRSTLAIYFIPITVIPALFLSYYSSWLFENSTRDNLISRARVEREAIVAELTDFEKKLVADARVHARSSSLVRAMRDQSRGRLRAIANRYRKHLQVRFYSPAGRFLVSRDTADEQIPYISKKGLFAVKSRGFTVDKFFVDTGIKFVMRALLQDEYSLHGIIEEEYVFTNRDLGAIKGVRQVDLVLLNRDMNAVAASFALSQDAVKSISKAAFRSSFQAAQEPVPVRVGDSRFAAFLYDLTGPDGKKRGWGHFAVFLSMNATDALIGKINWAMVYVTALLVLVASLLIFIFSRRLVSPIEDIVYGMKQLKSGRMEQIPDVTSTYEIEYLVRSFNEMSRNIEAAKRTLELKLEELRRANLEIKNTQSTLIQSAKMISLGQLVAGVAHELNNPIAFIYSNMLHLTEYVEKLKEIVRAYREAQAALPESERKRLKDLEQTLEIDYILEDMVELTRSCVDGANRTKDIVLGLRTFSRMEESRFQVADIHDGLSNTVRLLVTEFKDRITIHKDFGSLPSVECSLSQLNQVFMNLISNAAQAIPEKGDIWIRTRRQGDFVEIDIEDNGAGIPPDALEKIFDPFYTTKKVGEGTGLGLSIAYGLIQKHGGSIDVDSQVGEGTLFRIRLPVRQTQVNVPAQGE